MSKKIIVKNNGREKEFGFFLECETDGNHVDYDCRGVEHEVACLERKSEKTIKIISSLVTMLVNKGIIDENDVLGFVNNFVSFSHYPYSVSICDENHLLQTDEEE